MIWLIDLCAGYAFRRGLLKSMKLIGNIIQTIDNFQRRHKFVGFPLAVIKKYSDDEAGYQAALLAYYGFLSLFPLLLVLTTILQIVLKHNIELQDKIISHATTFFPIVGAHLQQSIHMISKTGPALAAGSIFTLYGARGFADVFRHSVNHVWQIPRQQRSGFPLNLAKSLIIIIMGGLGLIIVSVVAGYGEAAGRNAFVQLGFALLSFVILFGLFTFLIKISLPMRINFKDVRAGAAIAAIGLGILQLVGGYLVTHELKHLDSLYGTFALVLGLFFWLYLQAQVVLYSLEIETVYLFKLWPRSLIADNLTPEDIRAYKLYTRRNRFIEIEEVKTSFHNRL
jgi:YihY family inner membrane protein